MQQRTKIIVAVRGFTIDEQSGFSRSHRDTEMCANYVGTATVVCAVRLHRRLGSLWLEMV